MIKYLLIPENEINLNKEAKKNSLTALDGEMLIENEGLIKRWLLKSKLSYQLSLSLGTAKGNEDKVYTAMETIDELIKSIESVAKSFEKYNIELEEKKNK